MAAGNVSSVYIGVIDDVISKVREEFVNSGAGEAVLNELQALWEMKMLQCGAITGSIERPPPQKTTAAGVNPVHDLNVPYEGPIEEYETPTAEMLFPPTPLQTPMRTPLPGTGDQGMYNIPTGPSDYAPSPLTDFRNGLNIKPGRHSPYMQSPSPWTNQQRPLGVDVNVAYEENRDDTDRGASNQPLTQDFLMMASGKRKRDDNLANASTSGQMPQRDGSVDMTIEFVLPKGTQFIKSSISNTEGSASSSSQMKSTNDARASSSLPQMDGIHDDYDELFPIQGVSTEDYNTPADHELRAPTPAVATPRSSRNEVTEDDEPPLNEDDDDEDDLDDLEQGEEETHTQHLVLAQFDKVTRTKSRWKCTLKDGIMHLNGRDVLFNKANGEFDF